MTETHQGGCLCGAVRYRVTGRPKGAYVCHCTYCQHSSGTAFQMPVFFERTDVEFSGHPLSTYEHVSPTHGRVLCAQFCARCGTRVGTTISRAPQYQLISAMTFDDPDWCKIEAHIFTDFAPSWMAFPGDVRCYAKHFITEGGEKERPLPPQSTPWSRQSGSDPTV